MFNNENLMLIVALVLVGIIVALYLKIRSLKTSTKKYKDLQYNQTTMTMKLSEQLAKVKENAATLSERLKISEQENISSTNKIRILEEKSLKLEEELSKSKSSQVVRVTPKIKEEVKMKKSLEEEITKPGEVPPVVRSKRPYKKRTK